MQNSLKTGVQWEATKRCCALLTHQALLLVPSAIFELRQNEAQEILRQRKLGFSFVRLLPKETGIRPIVNLRRRVDQVRLNTGRCRLDAELIRMAF